MYKLSQKKVEYLLWKGKNDNVFEVVVDELIMSEIPIPNHLLPTNLKISFPNGVLEILDCIFRAVLKVSDINFYWTGINTIYNINAI